MIDLNTCVSGDVLLLRDGRAAVYVYRADAALPYRHRGRLCRKGAEKGTDWNVSWDAEGRYNFHDNCLEGLDVMAVFRQVAAR